MAVPVTACPTDKFETSRNVRLACVNKRTWLIITAAAPVEVWLARGFRQRQATREQLISSFDASVVTNYWPLITFCSD